MQNTLAPGIVLQGQYRILKVLGIGGMGAVYLAEDQQLFGKQWAIKELIDSFTNPQERAAAWQQFEQEARILVSLDHPNLPKIVRYFSEQGRLYLVMEYIDGRTLEEILEQTPGFLSEAQVVDWARQICDVLDYLHSRVPPVIFRDLKPSNIMLGRDNRIRLIDFGIARLFDPRKQTDTLKMGTHGYAPPEQYAGLGRTDGRSDLYGLGATMYHLLTNQVPVDSVQRILPQPTQLVPPRGLNPSLTSGVEQVILTAMNEHPDQRYQSASQLKAALSGQAVAVAPSMTARCSRCGAVNRSTARFCSGCGQTMSLVPPAGATPAQAGRKSFPRPVRVGLGLSILLVLAIAVAAVWLQRCGTTARPTETVIAGWATPGATLTAPAPVPTEPPPASPIPSPVSEATAALPPADSTPLPATDTAVPPAQPTSPAGSPVRVVGEPWEQEGVSLIVTAIDVRPEEDWQDAAVQTWFRFFNKTGQKLLVEIDWNEIYVEDSLGNRYVDWEGGGGTSVWVEAGENYGFDRYYSRQPGERSRVPADTAFVQVVADRFSRVSGARWRMEINPRLATIAAPDPAAVKGVGESWEGGGLALTLDKIDIRAGSDWEDAAAQAWFVLTNHGSERVLVEIDFSRIYLLDSFGRRYMDWEGGGLEEQWLDPGKTWKFNRYYSEMARWRSRITRGAAFVLVVADNIPRLGSGQWQVDIKSMLSSLPSPGAGVVRVIDSPWEQDGVSMTATRVEVRAESDWKDAAAQVWFRFFNKTGQRLLVKVDWSDIHLEDSLGNRYVDWEGGGTTNVWVETGESYDFDRYYTRQPGERSRVPANAAFVQAVVDRFSRIVGARWQMDINPVLSSVSAPDPAMVKGVGEIWEQGDLALTLEEIEVRADSDWQDAAAQAWFMLTNVGSETALVEIDLGYIYLVDSFGRRFGDWEGGGLIVQWLEPGETVKFDRYYSEMAGQKSRVTRGSEFVLVNVDRLGGIEGAQWQFDIVR